MLATAALVLLLGTGLAGLWAWSHSRTVSARTPRLAVLPFENLGAAEDDYFADGIADDVRGKLAALPGLQVIARASAVQYKNPSKTLQQIAQELDVEYLLTGTVRWGKGQGNARRVRVSPELIQAATGTTRWQQPFDTELNDVFQVQADIAQRVADALNVALGAGTQERLARRATSNVAAYDAYLRGEQLSRSDAVTDTALLRQAIAQYEKAVALDPSFAEAWAQLSRAACGITGLTPTPQIVEQCQSSAERALSLDPDLPLARLAMEKYQRMVVRDYDKAGEQVALGLQVAPNNPELLTASANIERRAGHRDAALVHLEQVGRMDPRSLPTFSALGRTYHDLHRYEEAIAAYDRALALAPTNLATFQSKARVFLSKGDLDGARRVIRDAVEKVDAKSVVVRFATYEEMMWVLPDDLRKQVVDLQPEDFDNNRGQWALKVGATWRLMGDAGRATEYGAIAATGYEQIARRFPNDPQQQEFYGRALALAGRCTEAIPAGERSLSHSEDAVSLNYFQYQVARIHLQCGQNDRALDLIEKFIAVPGVYTPGWLRIDPIFSPLRGNPRFERLLKPTT